MVERRDQLAAIRQHAPTRRPDRYQTGLGFRLDAKVCLVRHAGPEVEPPRRELSEVAERVRPGDDGLRLERGLFVGRATAHLGIHHSAQIRLERQHVHDHES
ncbi:MAG: hypothetical protein AMS20_09625 [Gemmatimonas sp. SG8_28]|nr:MAG: hypothetical protein AMS20_09625 [Gemmatimonas sp. SG8_28]